MYDNDNIHTLDVIMHVHVDNDDHEDAMPIEMYVFFIFSIIYFTSREIVALDLTMFMSIS